MNLMNETISHNNSVPDFTQTVAANELPSGVINNTPVEGARSHFRSRTFTSFMGCNPLVAAANTMLAFNERLKDLTHCDNINQLHLDLVHEIRAFESNAQERGYTTETIVIARYTLCATIDETIIYGALENSSLWQRYKLINTFQNEQTADERFFLILERLFNAPAVHIDLLELIYTCLSLGFEGKFRYENNGYHQLRLLIDHLYQQIRIIRNDPPRLPTEALEPIQEINTTTSLKIPSQTALWPVVFKTVAATLIGMSLIYGSFAFVYNKISAPVQTQISTLLKTQQ